MKRFSSFDEYEDWASEYEAAYGVEKMERTAVLIDDGFKMSMDMTTDCKSFKTALRRFQSEFAGLSEDVAGWISCMVESNTSDKINSDNWYKWNTDEDIKEYAQFGTYNWGVEEMNDNEWYMYLNISGVYAGR